MLSKTIKIYQDFDSFCASYHTVVEDKKAKKGSKNKEPMILEMVGYLLQHPENKNIGVNFDFSHRYYKGNEDETQRMTRIDSGRVPKCG